MDSMKTKRVVSVHEVTDGKDDDVLWLPMKAYEKAGRMYISSDLTRMLLEKQKKIGCACGMLCNFGYAQKKRENTRRGVVVYLNCGKNREHTPMFRGEKGAEDECDMYCVATIEDAGYVWDHAPERAWRHAMSTNAAPQKTKSVKRQRPEEEEVDVRVGTGLAGTAAEDKNVIWPCPGCRYRPLGWDKVDEKTKKSLEAIIKSLIS